MCTAENFSRKTTSSENQQTFTFEVGKTKAFKMTVKGS